MPTPETISQAPQQVKGTGGGEPRIGNLGWTFRDVTSLWRTDARTVQTSNGSQQKKRGLRLSTGLDARELSTSSDMEYQDDARKWLITMRVDVPFRKSRMLPTSTYDNAGKFFRDAAGGRGVRRGSPSRGLESDAFPVMLRDGVLGVASRRLGRMGGVAMRSPDAAFSPHVLSWRASYGCSLVRRPASVGRWGTWHFLLFLIVIDVDPVRGPGCPCPGAFESPRYRPHDML